VLEQDYLAPVEVVLAVGPSRDRTLDIAERLAGADPRITVVANPSGRIPAAVNAAIKVSRYPIIARVDGHALVPAGYLQQAVRTLQETGADNVGGIMAAEGGTPFEEAVAWAMTSKAGVGGARFHTGGRAGPVDSVYLGVYRRAAIEQVGGYDEAYQRAEDWEMNHRIRLSGGLIWFQPKLRVTYRPRASVAALGAQYFHYGRWRRVVARQHAGTINLRYLAPPAAVLAIAMGILAGLAGATFGPGWLIAGFIVPGAYLAGVMGVAALAARRARARVVARIPVILATMHICWGVGFLTSPRSLIPGRAPGAGQHRLVGPDGPAPRARGLTGQ